MPEENNISFQLGQLSGKLDGVLASQSSMNTLHTTHAADDNKRFGDIQREVEKIKERQMLWAGGLAVGSAFLSIAGQSLLGHFIK